MIDVEDYIPHKPPMRLLETVEQVDPEGVVAGARIRADNVFYDPELGGVPAWAGLEYLAQTAAVWVGADSRRRGLPIQPAFLVSSRHYSADIPLFPCGESLRVRIVPDLVDGSLVAFSGTIHNQQGERRVEAVFAAFQPDDADAYLAASEPSGHTQES